MRRRHIMDLQEDQEHLEQEEKEVRHTKGLRLLIKEDVVALELGVLDTYIHHQQLQAIHLVAC